MALMLADLDPGGLAETAALAGRSGPGKVFTQVTDVSDAAAVRHLADRCFGELGAVHVLCNNAGVYQGGHMWTRTAEDFAWLLGVNLWGVLHGALAVAAGLVVTVLVLVVAYRWVDPPISALMLSQSLAGTPIERTWVPLERISPHLIRAVVLSEDAAFCRHHGVDWAALEEAIESDRGGSTITMQVVKNLFLWPSRSYVRKAIEIGLAYLVEAVWSKRRILEIYLNIAEWGDGVFGAEAAAHAHFDKRASRLTPGEAALLAVALPNPIERTPAAPSLATGRLASRLLMRMAAARADLSCVPVTRAAPRRAPLVPGPRLTL
jgi:monofunctional biosynthetic peptidoglycan transglycosylase